MPQKWTCLITKDFVRQAHAVSRVSFFLPLLVFAVSILAVSAPPLAITNLSPASYSLAQLGAGDAYYIDRAYTLTSIPPVLGGGTWIKTANEDKLRTGTGYVSFNVNTNVIVYVAYSAGASVVPSWLSGWTNTGLLVQTTDVPFRLYQRTFPSGAVSLGGNMAQPAQGSTENYIVVVKEDVPDSAPPGVNIASPIEGQTVAGLVTMAASATDDVGVAGVQFFVDGAPVGIEDVATPYTAAWETRNGSTGFHTLWAVARDSSGRQTTSAHVSVTVNNPPDTQPPLAPANLTATPVSASQINLSWTASTDDVGVSGYRVYRNGAMVASTVGTSYQDTGLTGSTAYNYTVIAVDFAGSVSPPSGAVSATTAAGALKRIYLAGDDHTDYYWTADGPTYRNLFTQMLDHYMDQINATANQPREYQAKWNTDGTLWLWEYERMKPARFPELISRIKDGHITVPLDPLALTYGAQSAESALRGLYYAGRLERRFDFRFELAQSVENPGHPLGLASLWSGAGAKYTWNGLCGCLAETTGGRQNRSRDIYYWVGPDGSRLLTKWYSYVHHQSIGGYAEARSPAGAADYLANNSNFAARYPYSASAAIGYGWDDPATYLTTQISNVARNWTTPNRQVSVSNILDFFKDFEASHGAGLPTRSVSFGNERELSRAQLAERTARIKRSVEKLRSAEALAALVSLKDPSFLNGRAPQRDQAFMNMGLFFEHNWRGGGGVPISSWRSWIASVVTQVEGYVNGLHSDAVTAFSAMIGRTGANPRFFAFNPLSWVRTDAADVAFSNPGTQFHVVDLATGQETPFQWVTDSGQSKLRVLARDIPALGYKVFEIRPGAGASFSNAAAVTGNVISNQFYDVSVAGNGSITSLIDRQRNNRQFVQAGSSLNDLGNGNGTITVENAGPVSVTLRVNATSPLAHTTRVTLLRDSDRIDIRNEITQNFGNVRAWAFRFNLPSPDVWHEELGTVIRAKLATSGGHYSPTEARYDWLTLNHFADMSGGGVGITLSNADALFMKLGNSTMTTLDTATPSLTVLAGGDVVNVDPYALANDPHNQFGDSYFLQRFALRTHDAFNSPDAMRFSLQHQNPLVTAWVTGSGGAYPSQSFSFVNVSNPNVALWALKPAEEGIEYGIIARIMNLSSAPASTTVGLTSPLGSARRTTLIETDLNTVPLSGNAIQTSLAPAQMQAFRFSPQPAPDNTPPQVTLTAPGPNATLSGTVTIAATATDDVGVAGVRFQVNGSDLATDTTAPYMVAWNTAGVPNGMYTLTAVAHDAAGNLTVSAPRSVRVDNFTDVQPPSTSLAVTNLSRTTYQIAKLAVGSAYYIDRPYTLTAIPPILSGGTWIKTANNDKSQTAASFLSFVINVPATVYVAYTASASSLPAWLSGWTNTGAVLQTSDVPLRIYSRAFPAGSVVLGGNMASPAQGSRENYVVIVVSAGPAPPPDAPQGLAGYWRLDEASGTSASDSSGNNNTGTLMNGPVWTNGKFSGGLSLDGSNDHVSVPDSNALDLSGSGTIEVWFKRASINKWGSLVAKGNANSNAAHNYFLEFNPANRLTYGVGSASAVAQGTSTLTITDTASFHHVAFSWDGASLRLYVDGVLHQTVPQTVTPAANTSPLFIGQFGGNTDRFHGVIDGVRIYNRVLSLAEIQSHMSSPNP